MDHGASGNETGEDAIRTLDEHRECMALVAEVERCLDRTPDRESWLAELRDKLPKLAEKLDLHFRDEETQYLYREVPLSFPRFSDRLESLKSEHRDIMAAARSAIDKAKGLGSAEMHELRELNARIQLLVATIRRHEAEENEILLRAYWHDVGAGD